MRSWLIERVSAFGASQMGQLRQLAANAQIATSLHLHSGRGDARCSMRQRPFPPFSHNLSKRTLFGASDAMTCCQNECPMARNRPLVTRDVMGQKRPSRFFLTACLPELDWPTRDR